jgi:hypothetical protein
VLARDLDPVIERYMTSPGIVFVSICTDRSREMWKSSLRSGGYTSEKAINLFTNGFGENHPMIKFYKYDGFPQLLIIDGEGKIVSANPPRPNSNQSWDKALGIGVKTAGSLPTDPHIPLSENTRAFIKILDDQLRKDP